MKIEKTENGVRFTAETPFEKECLEHLVNKGSLTAKFEDTWDRKGPVTIEGKPFDWGR